MRQNERNGSRTEVPEARVPVVECLDGFARITSKELCTNSFCEKWHPPVCLFYKSENGCRFGEKCFFLHRQVEEQPSKRSKKNGDKFAEAMLKKHEQHHRTERPVVYAYSSNTRQAGCVFHPGYGGAAEVFIDFTEELRHTETDPMCNIHRSRCTSR